MTDSLDPHQHTGAAFLAERYFALLWDQMGLGKTATAVRACDLAGARRVLVLCPRSVKRHWERSFLRWQTAARAVLVHEGRPSAPFGEGVHVATHASMAHPASAAALVSHQWDVLVLDEATEYRDFSAARTRAVFGEDGLWRRARHVWPVTGDPVVNSAADLYPLAYGPWSAALGQRCPDWYDFCREFAWMRTNSMGEQVPGGVRNADGLAALLRPFVLRRTARSVGMPLPPLQVGVLPVEVPDHEIAQLAHALGDAGWSPEKLLARAGEIAGEPRDPALMRIWRALGILKAAPAARVVFSEIEAGRGPVLAFFQHTDVRRVMHGVLSRQGLRVAWIDGTVGRGELDAAEADYQAGRLDALLVQTQAGGLGLTLTRGNRVVTVESPWTATQLHQAIARAHRRGQLRAVGAVILQARSFWLEEVMQKIIAQKDFAARNLLDRLTTE